MAVKKLNNNSTLKLIGPKYKGRYDRSWGTAFVLINTLTAIASGKPISRRAHRYLEKVFDAFVECYEQRFPERDSWMRMHFVDQMAKAYGELNPSKRKKMIDETISHIDAAKVNRGSLNSSHLKKLHEMNPRSSSGKRSGTQLALERLEYYLEAYSARTYHRNKRDSVQLQERMFAHYGNTFYPHIPIYVCLVKMFGLKIEESRQICDYIIRKNWLNDSIPVASGKSAYNWYKMARHEWPIKYKG